MKTLWALYISVLSFCRRLLKKITFCAMHLFINEEEGYLLQTWTWKITCQHFNWMLQSYLCQKLKKKCEQTLLFSNIRHWRSMVGEDSFSLPTSSQQFSNLRLPVLHLVWIIVRKLFSNSMWSQITFLFVYIKMRSCICRMVNLWSTLQPVEGNLAAWKFFQN